MLYVGGKPVTYKVEIATDAAFDPIDLDPVL
jgi:hypothetical protein